MSSPGILWLKGFEFDIVTSVSVTFPGEQRSELWQTITHTWAKLIEPLSKQPRTIYQGQDPNTVFHDALTAGKDW